MTQFKTGPSHGLILVLITSAAQCFAAAASQPAHGTQGETTPLGGSAVSGNFSPKAPAAASRPAASMPTFILEDRFRSDSDLPFNKLKSRVVDLDSHLPRKVIETDLLRSATQAVKEHWPEATVKREEGHIRIWYHCSVQSVMRRKSKTGGLEPRTEFGPDPDGFEAVMWLDPEERQAVRPQTIHYDPWKTFLGEVRLHHPATRLYINVSYGRDVDGERLQRLIDPVEWLRPAHTTTRPSSQSAE